jgi:hypothetical protein
MNTHASSGLRIATLLGLVLAAGAQARPSSAQPTAPIAIRQCSNGIGPLPSFGSSIARISQLNASGKGAVTFEAPASQKQAPKRGDDVYLADCVGNLVRGGEGKVESVDGQTAKITFKSLSDASGYGPFVFIDTGRDSAPPRGIASVPITDLRPSDDGATRVTIGVGEEDGVFAGAEVRFVLNNYTERLVLNTATREASIFQTKIGTDNLKNGKLYVRLGKPRCFPPKPLGLQAASSAATSNVAPKRYAFVDATVVGPVATVAKGSSDGIASSEGYILLGNAATMTLRKMDAKSATYTVPGSVLSSPAPRSARALLPLLPPAGSCIE